MNHGDGLWAQLSNEQLGQIQEAERTLGVDVLLAYKSSVQDQVSEQLLSSNRLKVASMNDSQLECLQGLEKKLPALIIAYQQA